MQLPDVNVWLAMTFVSHLHHPSANAWFETVADGGCVFCRLTQQGFLRLATNPKVFGAQAVALSEAWDLFDQLMGDPRVCFAHEPTGLESKWRGFTNRSSFSPKVWNDAYLAAFAQAAGLDVITFDKGFAQFPRVAVTLLS